jgi:hypothetical protein
MVVCMLSAKVSVKEEIAKRPWRPRAGRTFHRGSLAPVPVISLQRSL